MDSLESLQLYIVVSHHVCVGTQTQVLWKNSMCSWLLSQPFFFLFLEKWCHFFNAWNILQNTGQKHNFMIVVALFKCSSDNSRITNMSWCWVKEKKLDFFLGLFNREWALLFSLELMVSGVSIICLLNKSNLCLPECCLSLYLSQRCLLCIYLTVHNEGTMDTLQKSLKHSFTRD